MTFRILVYAMLVTTSVLAPAYADNAIQTENAKTGTTDWRLSNPRFPVALQDSAYTYMNVPYDSPNVHFYADSEIQGYASLTSVNKGGVIKFFVRTSVSAPYTMKFYRVGWYGGLGGRDVTADGITVPSQFTGSPHSMPSPDLNNSALIECNWPVAYTLVVPSTWVSGVYLVKLETGGRQSYIIFVVRDDQSSSPYLMQTSVNTYQAYNEWGGSSLYTSKNSGGGKTGYKVSFNRPYWRDWGAGDFLRYEINMVRWLEQEGYDVTYVTDVDVHAQPDLLLSHQGFFVVGHDEYWSWQMRANVERARDRGVSLGFFCANSAYWQVRFAPSTANEANRTIVAYKEDAINDSVGGGVDPYTIDETPSNNRYITTWWSKIGTKAVGTTYADPVYRPEEMLLGVQYELLPDCGSCPLRGDIKVSDPSHWLYASTGVSSGTRLPNILGYETDMMHHYQPVGTASIARSLFPSETALPRVDADMTVYTAPSGSTVFATGSIFWNTGLSDFGTRLGSSPTDFCYQKPVCDEAQWGLSKGVVPEAQQVTRNFLSRVAATTIVPASSRLTATATASTTNSESPLVNINDGSLSTAWRSTDLTPVVTLDLQSRQWIQRLRWEGVNGQLPAYPPADYSILISDNGVNWQQLRSWTSPPNTWVVHGSEPINAQARYIRLQVSKVADGSGWPMGLYELWVEGAPPPPAGRLPVRSARGSGEVSGHTVGSASDFNLTTFWAANNIVSYPNNNNAWYRLDLGTSRHIDRVRWSAPVGAPVGSTHAFPPRDYAIHMTDTDTSPCAGTPLVSRVGQGQDWVANGNEALSSLGRYVWFCTSVVSDGSGWPLGLYEFWAEGSDASNILGSNALIIQCGDDVLPPVIDAQNPVANAVDGSTSTWFRATPGAYSSNDHISIRLDFGSVKQIDRLRWHGLNGATDPSVWPAHSPTKYSIEVSNDGSCESWSTVVPETDHGGPVIEGDELLNARGRYLRLRVTKVNDGTGWALGFKEIWAEGY